MNALLRMVGAGASLDLRKSSDVKRPLSPLPHRRQTQREQWIFSSPPQVGDIPQFNATRPRSASVMLAAFALRKIPP